jgi:putative transposase
VPSGGRLSDACGVPSRGALRANHPRHHLEHVLHTYVTHYNHERPDRALALAPPEAISGRDSPPAATIERHDLLDGLIHEYRAAA